MPIEAVVFDVGRVLLDLDYRALTTYLAQHRIAAVDLPELVARIELEAHECGELSGEAMLDKFVKFAPTVDRTAVRALWLDIFTPIDPMFDLVQQLMPHYRVYLLSNVGDLHWQHLTERYRLDTLGHGALPSFVAGSMKPSAAIYRAAEQCFRLDPARTVFIDDLEPNVQGARACGWQALRHENHTATVAGLAELGVTVV